MKQENRLPIFREHLRELMGDLSVTDFAQKIGLTRQTVGFYLNGDRIPDCETLALICSKCDVSANWLLGLSDVKSPCASIAAINQLTGLSELSIQRLIEANEIRQQARSSQRVEEILKDEAWLERKHIEAIMDDDDANSHPEIQVLLNELGLSDCQENRELLISAAVNNRLNGAAKEAAYQETIMIDALNYMIEGEENYNVLHMIALYLLIKPSNNRYLRLFSTDNNLATRYIHMENDLFSNTLLLEIETQLKELSKDTKKLFAIDAI